MDPKEFDKVLQGLIETLLGRVQSATEGLQNRTLARLIERLEDLKKSQGIVSPTVANLKEAKRIQSELAAMFSDPAFTRDLDRMEKEIRGVALEIEKYLVEVFGNEFKPGRTVLEDIVANAILTTRQTLTQTVVADTVPALEKLLNQYVTTGGTYTEMLATVTDIMRGTTEKLGSLVGASKLVLNDTIHQFSRNYILSATGRIDGVFYLYSGGTVADSREFCVARTGQYWHIEEIRKWGTTPKKWDGRNPATSPSTIFYLLGGYNCQHTLIPAALPSVPKSDIERAHSKGLVSDKVYKEFAAEK